MTVILATPTVLYADSYTSWGNVRMHNPGKVFRCGNDIVGMAGDWGNCASFQALYCEAREADEDGERGELDAQTVPGHGEVDALILRDGGIYWAGGDSCVLRQIHEPFWAIGTGTDVVLGAMWAGLGAFDAMAIAMERSVGCGWPLWWYHVDGREGSMSREQWMSAAKLTKGAA